MCLADPVMQQQSDAADVVYTAPCAPRLQQGEQLGELVNHLEGMPRKSAFPAVADRDVWRLRLYAPHETARMCLMGKITDAAANDTRQRLTAPRPTPHDEARTFSSPSKAIEGLANPRGPPRLAMPCGAGGTDSS